jgi:hypothetical protein
MTFMPSLVFTHIITSRLVRLIEGCIQGRNVLLRRLDYPPTLAFRRFPSTRRRLHQ